ncbi:MAG: hypothetical protein JZU65_09115 [Chlorobium sp.]|nr:hypothetical protein [Chlorobium sp.]
MCFRHDEDEQDLFEPDHLAVSLGVKLLEQTGAISALYVDHIVARHVLGRCYRSVHPIDATKPCGEDGTNAISVISEYVLGIIAIQLPEEE